MLKKIKQIALETKLGDNGEVLPSKHLIELDDHILQSIAGSSGNLDCTNEKDCRSATNHGSCSNTGTCYASPEPSFPGGA